jgi:serine/threonine protein kinase
LRNYKNNFVLNQYNLLVDLNHPNIIKVIEYFERKENQYIVFEYCPKDLLKIINDNQIEINETLIRTILKQIIQGVEFLHSKGVIHRDLKPENILINSEGNIILTDFDLARYFDTTERPLSKGVATIYYRPPEIFFGDNNYSYSVDMWAIGCILAELILREPLFKGRSELDVISKIFDLTGCATVRYLFNKQEDNWEGCSHLPNFMPFTNPQVVNLRDVNKSIILFRHVIKKLKFLKVALIFSKI